MRLLINCSVINSSGPVQVALSFVNECKNIPHDYHVIVGPTFGKVIDTSLFPTNFHFYYIEKRLVSGFAQFFKGRRLLKKFERQIKPDVVFSVFGPSYWRPKVKHVQGFATPQVVYPDSPYFSLLSRKERVWWQFHRIVQLFLIWYESDAIILETKVIQKRLTARIPKIPTYIVPNTFSSTFNKLKEVSVNKNKTSFKLLTLSSYKRHKNIEIIPRVINELQKRNAQNVTFYVTLPTDKFKAIIPVKYQDNVINLGVLHPDECPKAYSIVDAMFLPTLLEGFSASYPEAMSMKKPILTSNYDFAIEICGEAAIYFNPLDASSIADTIIKVMNNQDLREALILSGNERLTTFGNATQRARDYLRILVNHA